MHKTPDTVEFEAKVKVLEETVSDLGADETIDLAFLRSIPRGGSLISYLEQIEAQSDRSQVRVITAALKALAERGLLTMNDVDELLEKPTWRSPVHAREFASFYAAAIDRAFRGKIERSFDEVGFGGPLSAIPNTEYIRRRRTEIANKMLKLVGEYLSNDPNFIDADFTLHRALEMEALEADEREFPCCRRDRRRRIRWQTWAWREAYSESHTLSAAIGRSRLPRSRLVDYLIRRTSDMLNAGRRFRNEIHALINNHAKLWLMLAKNQAQGRAGAYNQGVLLQMRDLGVEGLEGRRNGHGAQGRCQGVRQENSR